MFVCLSLLRQTMYNVTLRHVCATITAISITYYDGMFVELTYPTCSVQWPVHLCRIFPHYLINGTILIKS